MNEAAVTHDSSPDIGKIAEALSKAQAEMEGLPPRSD
jgi:hypothetical protein